MKKHEDTYGKLASVEARRPRKTTRIILARLQKNAGRRKRGQQSIVSRTMKKTQEKTMEQQVRAIIFDDEYEILEKVKFNNHETVSQQVERFKVESLIALFQSELQSHDATLLARIEEMVGKDYWGDCRDGFQAKLIDDIKKLIEGK